MADRLTWARLDRRSLETGGEQGSNRQRGETCIGVSRGYWPAELRQSDAARSPAHLVAHSPRGEFSRTVCGETAARAAKQRSRRPRGGACFRLVLAATLIVPALRSVHLLPSTGSRKTAWQRPAVL
jgi:hypothetical protein